MNNFLEEKEKLLNSIENNTPNHWKEYYKNVPLDCIFDDLVIDVNEIKRLTKENQQLKGSLQTYEILLKANAKENQQLKEEKRLILKDISFWIRNSKAEQIEGDMVHQRYWMCFEDIINKIFKKYNTENLSDEDLKYNHYLEKENEELIKKIQQKDSTLNEIRQYVEEHTFDTYFVKADPKDILEMLDNESSDK